MLGVVKSRYFLTYISKWPYWCHIWNSTSKLG